MIRRYIPKSVDELADWYMRYISPLALVAAVIADNLIFLRRVDLWTSNALLFFYLTVATICIVVLNLIELGRLRHPWVVKIFPLVPVVAQFAFGGLFAAYVSLYSRSAAYTLSWIFVLGVAALLIGNERFFRLYRRFSFQMTMYFVVLFSFLIFFLPLVFDQIGPHMFVASGITALVLVGAFASILFHFFPERKVERTSLARSVAVIFAVFNVLYFTNAIPPLPLALKEAGVFHDVRKTADGYVVSYEPVPWYESFLRYNTVFHRAAREDVYVWSAIFAPTGLSTMVLHEWQHYDTLAHEWRTMQTVRFSIQGGRDGGYRGYSAREDPESGAWRVNVITPHGQIIGRVSFVVVDVTSPIAREEMVR